MEADAVEEAEETAAGETDAKLVTNTVLAKSNRNNNNSQADS